MLAARESWVGPSFLSTIRQETPCRFSSAAMNRPTGPAPTTNTWLPVATRYPKTPRLPHISHCARASVVERDANSPSNLLSSVTPLARRNSAPAEASAESFTGKRTVDDKARSGKRLEHRRQRRIAHPVVCPGDPATQRQHRIGISRATAIERERKTAGDQPGLGVAGRVEKLRLDTCDEFILPSRVVSSPWGQL